MHTGEITIGAIPTYANHNPNLQLLGLFFVLLAAVAVHVMLGVPLLALALGPVTISAIFADAWVAGIRRRLHVRAFANLSPLGWAACTAFLLAVALPAYALCRGRSRTQRSTNLFFWLAMGTGTVMLLTMILFAISRSV
jgi:hypothetical protein